jgi:large subunit ribosomal protein L28
LAGCPAHLGTPARLDSDLFCPVAPRLKTTSRPDQEITVAANCDVCGKGPGFGHNISHSHRRTKRRWNPNIQRVRAMVGSTPKRLNVCTSCLKAGKVTR